MKIEEIIALDDAPSARSIDDNGYMHVALSHITKAQVVPYWGREIPAYEERGLEPDKLYYAYRDPKELKKSLNTWNGLPIHLEHHVDSADDPQKSTRVGSSGTDARWDDPYIDNSLVIWDADAQEKIKNGSYKELSCAYRYTPDFTAGNADGIPYDFVMREIKGNHIALVERGRAGRDVVVADAAPKTIKETETKNLETGDGKMADMKKQPDDIESKALDDMLKSLDDGKADEPAADTKVADKPDDVKGKDDDGENEPDVDPKDPDATTSADDGKKEPDDEPVGDDDGDDDDKDKDDEDEDEKMSKFVEALTDMQAKKLVLKLKERLIGNEDKKADKKDEGEDKAAKDCGAKDNKPAMDADSIRRGVMNEFRARFNAVRAVRKTCGDLDPMAFDSAAEIYGHALKSVGIACDSYPMSSWAGMYAVYEAAAKNRVNTRVMESGDFSGAFAGLKNISIGE